MDVFKHYNVAKQACSFCPPYCGENEGLRSMKGWARRRARRTLKRLDRWWFNDY